MYLISLLTKRLNWFQDAFQHALEANEGPPLSRAEALVIANMAAGETRASNIARNLGVSRQAISQILSELSDRGIVIVEDNPHDRRSRIARLARDLEDEDELCVQILIALERELEWRIGARLMKSLYEALEGEWGHPPVSARLSKSSQSSKTAPDPVRTDPLTESAPGRRKSA